MKQKMVLLLFFTFLSNQIYAQALDIVRDFGNSMNLWTVSHDIIYCEHLDSLCDKNLRISDKIAEDIISNEKLDGLNSLRLATYLNWMEMQMFDLKEEFVVEFSEYAILDKTKDIKCMTKFAKEKIKDGSREYLTCKITISGLSTYDERVLICVRGNKIFGITKLEKRGKRIVLK